MRYLLLFLCLSLPVWAAPSADEAAIRQLYDHYQKAYLTKDIKPVMDMTAPDFTAHMIDGKELNHADYQKVMEQQLQAGGKESFKIESLSVTGKQAKAQTLETIAVTAMADHVLKSVCRGVDTWVKTAAGWRITHTESLSEEYYMDDHPFDPKQVPTQP